MFSQFAHMAHLAEQVLATPKQAVAQAVFELLAFPFPKPWEGPDRDQIVSNFVSLGLESAGTKLAVGHYK
jgi:hypothetical protein